MWVQDRDSTGVWADGSDGQGSWAQVWGWLHAHPDAPPGGHTLGPMVLWGRAPGAGSGRGPPGLFCTRSLRGPKLTGLCWGKEGREHRRRGPGQWGSLAGRLLLGTKMQGLSSGEGVQRTQERGSGKVKGGRRKTAQLGADSSVQGHSRQTATDPNRRRHPERQAGARCLQARPGTRVGAELRVVRGWGARERAAREGGTRVSWKGEVGPGA